jgi:hypothetical protein
VTSDITIGADSALAHAAKVTAEALALIRAAVGTASGGVLRALQKKEAICAARAAALAAAKVPHRPRARLSMPPTPTTPSSRRPRREGPLASAEIVGRWVPAA